jgi:hypothetical protein
MVTNPNAAMQTLGFPKLKTERFIPNLKGKADDDVVKEVRRLWNSTYALRDASSDLLDITLTQSMLINRDLVAGKPLLVILRQNSVGGWTWTWAKNADQTTKFKGTALMTPLVTTGGTYTVATFYATSETEAILTSWLTGGSLG